MNLDFLTIVYEDGDADSFVYDELPKAVRNWIDNGAPVPGRPKEADSDMGGEEVKPTEKRGRKSTKHSAANLARLTKICAMRRDGKTLDQIGTEFGVTRERARQLLLDAERITPEAYQETVQVIQDRKAEKNPPRVMRFKSVIYKWLEEAGKRYCCACKTVKEKSEFAPNSPQRMCRACNTARMKASREADPLKWREFHRKMQRLHPETQKRAQQAYRERRMAQDPEGFKRYWKEKSEQQWIKRKAKMAVDPVFREKCRLQERTASRKKYLKQVASRKSSSAQKTA